MRSAYAMGFGEEPGLGALAAAAGGIWLGVIAGQAVYRRRSVRGAVPAVVISALAIIAGVAVGNWVLRIEDYFLSMAVGLLGFIALAPIFAAMAFAWYRVYGPSSHA
jgi:hypothetical protein